MSTNMKITALYVNKFNIIFNSDGIVRFTFQEVVGAAQPDDITAIAMVRSDAIALRDLLSDLIQKTNPKAH